MSTVNTATAREKFVKLLRDDILQLDLAALDFGIYRILNYRRREIDAFLGGELPRRIDAAIGNLPGTAGEDEQGRIFHHLYTFFARYYDDGDFVTRPRRGHNAAYSVPYNGQDVHFWWATKGSHYVKSGERFTSYVWRDGARAIRIEVAQADVEKDNVKGAKRYYLPESIAEAGGELRIKLAFRPLDKDEVRRFETKRKRGTDDEAVDDGETIEGRGAQERILNHWLDGNGPRAAKVPAGVDEALLKKHVARYVAGQTQDFFVHPQLGAFLTGELDYYLKNEFLEIWDRADGDALARERGKLAVVRDIGRAIIAFLAAIEDVQAELFEKRKFVLASDWLARASALPQGKPAQALVAEACANRDQVDEWLRWLGEKPLPKTADAKRTAKRGAELLKSFPHLCIHTRHFDEAFKYGLLALFDDIEAATGGTLIHSENYAALRTLEYAYKQRVKCIYIDPPYNTGKDGFLYKDALEHATWISCIGERIERSEATLDDEGVFYASIDENERTNLSTVAGAIFPTDLCEIAVQTNAKGRVMDKQFSRTHEFLLARSKCELMYEIAKPKGDDRISRDYPLVERGNRYRLLEFRNTHREFGRHNRANMWFPIYVSTANGDVSLRSSKGAVKVLPTWDDGYDGCWSGREWNIQQQPGHFVGKKVKGHWKVYAKDYADGSTTRPKSIWNDSCFLTDKGAGALSDLFGADAKDNGLILELRPKPPALIAEAVVNLPFNDLLALDYFAGSGTTAHAVINLNRADGGTRKFVLVEQGEYFDTVLLPRVAKVIACPEWKDGKPKSDVAMQAAEGEDADAHWSARSPALVHVLRLERYEDSLDALELPSDAEARRAGQMSFADEPLRYVFESTAGKASVTLNHAQLAKPLDCTIPQTVNGAPALAKVDIAATALLLLGLHPVRVRDVQRKAGKTSQRYLFVEARPNGKPRELHLLFLRDCNDALTGEALRKHAEAEMQWLDEAIAREFGHKPGDYTTVWYNRDAVLSSPNGRSLDPEVIRRMLERAPVERDA